MFSTLTTFAAPISQVKAPDLPHGPTDDLVPTILSIAFGIIGALALLMIVISGLRYITSDGDPQKASSAKSGIIYALVGLAVAVLAQAIVVFVVRRVT